MPMDLDQIRNRYLKFFERQGHTIIPSSSLVPENDPSTLFTGAGMQPILPYLLGNPHPEGKRIVNSQKCFRAEDMDEVGDNRHTTFFEMLGNWSLGDYFKSEQLPWFFGFLTEDLGLKPEHLFVTVFAGDEKLNLPKDTESVSIWKELFKQKGDDAEDVFIGSVEEGAKKGTHGGRIFYYNALKNWWSRAGAPENMPAGEPGGPDSELFYEFRDIKHDTRFGEQCHVNCDCGHYMEIGNSVFMEYIKSKNGSFKQLPQRNADFGGGLERITAALADSVDIFKVSVLGETVRLLEKLSGKTYGSDEKQTRAFSIIADHLRAAVFISADGVKPSNKERGYILRRLLRRALLNAKHLGLSGTEWLGNIVDLLADSYKDFYAEIDSNLENIRQTLVVEAEKFLKTLDRGLLEIEKLEMKGGFDRIGPDGKMPIANRVDAKRAFYIFQSFGFPFEMIQEELVRRGLLVNKEEFDREFKEELKRHQETSRAGSEKKFKGGLADASTISVRYHTATHLLNQALRQVLGGHVYQKGSNITSERLRFDFPNDSKMTPEQIKEVESIVNAKIAEQLPVTNITIPLTEAQKRGVVGVFGERYPDTVTVYRIGYPEKGFFSQEICGGPHVSNTQELEGTFRITKEESVSRGVRRIKAVLER